jgi:SAM-dependent methyltransferase
VIQLFADHFGSSPKAAIGGDGHVTTDAWSPHGFALRDFFQGDALARVIVRDETGEEETVPVQVFFREPASFSALEEAALDLCRGRVLDVGAGAGCHSLVLQQRGLSVCAIDIAPEAVDVMRVRGVKDAHCSDLFAFQAEPFDTLLMLMNGVGIVGTLAGFRCFLRKVPRLLQPGGQILLDSYDPGWSEGSDAAVTAAGPGEYVGEMRFQLEYQGTRGPFYDWLFVDLPTLRAHAETEGWSCESIWHEAEGHYLARLMRSARSACA